MHMAKSPELVLQKIDNMSLAQIRNTPPEILFGGFPADMETLSEEQYRDLPLKQREFFEKLLKFRSKEIEATPEQDGRQKRGGFVARNIGSTNNANNPARRVTMHFRF